MAISCPALTVLLGGDGPGPRPHVRMAPGPRPRRAPDLGPVATVDHDCRRAGPRWAAYPLAGLWPCTIPRGAGGRRPADGRSPGGEALAGPAPRWPGGRPWPRGHGRGFPPPSRSPWGGWPASVQIRWAAASPRGMAPNGHASSWRRRWWRTAPGRPGGGCSPALSSSRGATISGGIPSPHGTPPWMRPSRTAASSTRVHGVMTRWSCPSTKHPLCRRVVVCLRRRLPSRGPVLPGRRMHTGAAEPCPYGPPSPPVRARSWGPGTHARVRRSA